MNDMVKHLKENGIEMVAIDFDQTLIEIHTGGEWWRDPEQLIPFIRPEFRHLLRHLSNHGFHIAIVSFSRQYDVIQACLIDILGEDAASRVIIRGYPTFWKGKQPHLQSLGIALENVLFIDDDQWNVLLAKKSGIPTIWFDPDHPETLWDDLWTAFG